MRWGTPNFPDSLGKRHQLLGICVAVQNRQACCNRCASTLACTHWTFFKFDRTCCMRRWLPASSFHDSNATAGRVLWPCSSNCSLPQFPIENGSYTMPWGSRHSASADEVPWLYPGETSPEYHIQAANFRSMLPPRIAVCLTGQARTLVHPTIYRSLHERLLDGGRHDLFMVLSTGSDGNILSGSDPRRRTVSNQGIDDQRLPQPRALQAALHHLRPLRTRFVLNSHTGREPCVENFATLQMLSWAACVGLVRTHEQRGSPMSSMGRDDPVMPYDFIFRSRPDLYWRAPAELSLIASHLRADMRVVITTNDWNMLVPRLMWGMLASVSGADCDQRCNGRSQMLLGAVFDDFNEYCLLLVHIARHGGRHIEVSHPDHAQMWHFVADTDAGETGWLKSLYHTNCPIARWERQPARRVRGTRIICRRVHSPVSPVRCSLCGPSPHKPCPIQPVEFALPRAPASKGSVDLHKAGPRNSGTTSPPARMTNVSHLGLGGFFVSVDDAPLRPFHEL